MKFFLQLVLIVGLVGSAFAGGPLRTRTAFDATLTNGFTIHHQRHEVVGDKTRLYLDDNSFVDVSTADIIEMTESQDPVSTAPELQRKDVDVKEAVIAASQKHLIDPDLISSVINAESRFNPHAVSPKGAQGLMQLMPATASRFGVDDPFDANANIDGGTRYLRELLLQYDGDIAKALAAYNAGPLRVQQYQGVPPYHETRAYVTQVIKEFNRKKLAQSSAVKHTNSKASSQAATSNSR